MNKISRLPLLFLPLLLLFAPSALAQGLPSVKLKDLQGKVHDTATFLQEGNPIIISFFGTWCKPCLRELDAIQEHYLDWHDETGVTLYAICINEGSDMHKAKPVANAHGWDFEVMLDHNLELKRAMNVQMVPSLFVLSGEGKIIYQSTGYVEGSEQKIINALRSLTPAKR